MSQIPDIGEWLRALNAEPKPEPIPPMAPARPRRGLPRRPGARRARG